MKLGERISFANKNRHGSLANKWSGKIMELKNSRVYMGKPKHLGRVEGTEWQVNFISGRDAFEICKSSDSRR